MKSPRRIVLPWSGGKDSSLALERLLKDPAVTVVGLLTTITTGYERISIHGIRRSILHQQIKALRLPVEEVEIPPKASNAIYEEAMRSALKRLRKLWPDLETLAFGDIFLANVRSYRESFLDSLGWKGLYPLWGEDTAMLSRRFVSDGYKAVLSCVDTTLLDARFAGREFDDALLAELPSDVDPCGERGEFHTCVYAAPIFRESISVKTGEKLIREGRFQYCDLLDDEPINQEIAVE